MSWGMGMLMMVVVVMVSMVTMMTAVGKSAILLLIEREAIPQ